MWAIRARAASARARSAPPADAAFYMYIVHPTGGAVPASEGGLTNLYAFLSAIIGSTAATVVGSYALPDE